MVVTFLIVLLTYLLTPSIILATSVFINSYPDKIVIGNEYNLEATFSASPNKEYMLKTRLGTESSSLKKALTKNENNPPPDDWLTDSDSWTKFPKVLTDEAGFWSGALKFKAGTSTQTGPNFLRLRVKQSDSTKYLDSGLYPNQVEPGAFTVATQETATTQEVKITSLSEKVKQSQEFEVKGTITYSPKSRMSLKMLIGSSDVTKDMKDGFTFGKDGWLAWNAAWSKFSEFETDNNGIYQFSLKGKTSSDIGLGTNYLAVRARDLSKETNFNSVPVSFIVEKSEERTEETAQTTPSPPEPTPVGTNEPEPTKNQEKTSSPEKIVTPAPVKSTAPSKTPKQSVKEEKSPKTSQKSDAQENKKDKTKEPVVKKKSAKEEAKKDEISKLLDSLDESLNPPSVLGEQASAPASLTESSIIAPKVKGLNRESYILIAVGVGVILTGLFQLIRDKEVLGNLGQLHKLLNRFKIKK